MQCVRMLCYAADSASAAALWLLHSGISHSFRRPADIVCLACSHMLIGEYVLMLCVCVLQLENMCVICYGAGEGGEYNAFACSLRITSRTV